MAQPTVATRVLDAAATALEALVERLRALANAGRPAGDGPGEYSASARRSDGQASPPEHWLALARRGAPQLLPGSSARGGRNAGPLYQTGPGAGAQRSASASAPAPAMPPLQTLAEVRKSARADALSVPSADDVPVASAVETEPAVSDPQAGVGRDGSAETPLMPHFNPKGETAAHHPGRPDGRLPPLSEGNGSLPRPVASLDHDRPAPRPHVAPAPAVSVLSGAGARPGAHDVDVPFGPTYRPEVASSVAPATTGAAAAALTDDDAVLRTVWPCLPGEGDRRADRGGDPADDPPAPWPTLPGEAGAVGRGGVMPDETRRRSGRWSV